MDLLGISRLYLGFTRFLIVVGSFYYRVEQVLHTQ